MERQRENREKQNKDKAWLHLLLFCFSQLINQINLAVSSALLEIEACVFILIAMLRE